MERLDVQGGRLDFGWWVDGTRMIGRCYFRPTFDVVRVHIRRDARASDAGSVYPQYCIAYVQYCLSVSIAILQYVQYRVSTSMRTRNTTNMQVSKSIQVSMRHPGGGVVD